MKKIILILFIFLNFIFIYVSADGVDDAFNNEVKSNVENAFDNANIEFDAIETIDKLNKGNFNFDYKNLGEFIKNSFLKELRENYGYFLRIFLLIILTALIDNIQISFKNDKTVNVIVSAVIVLSMITVTKDIADYTILIIDRLILFINSLIPTLMTLLATSGKAGTAGVLNPVMIGVSSVMSVIIKSFVIPLCLISLVLKLTGNITEKIHLKNFGNQIQKLIKWVLGIVFTVYVGIIGIIGVSAPKVDDIALKTAKYAVSNFIPVVGGVASDSVDLILTCSSIVKNSIGITGLIGIFIIVGVPCLKVAVKVIIVNVLTILSSTISSKNVSDSLNDVSSSLSLLLGMNVVVSIMYILSITVIIFIGGA